MIDIKVIYGKTFFELKPLTTRGERLLDKFSERFRYFRFDYDYRRKRYIRKLVKTFYLHNPKDGSKRFPVSTYMGFISVAKLFGLTADNIEVKPSYNTSVPVKNKISIRKLFDPRVEQVKYIKSLSDIKIPVHMVPLQTGKGKAEYIHNKIKTPYGFIPMKDIDVGMHVYNKDHIPVKVNAVYPQGTVRLYKVILEDGREIKCCKDHLWSTYVNGTNNKKTVSTEELLYHFNSSSLSTYHLDLPTPIDHDRLLNRNIGVLQLASILKANKSSTILKLKITTDDILFTTINYRKLLLKELLKINIIDDCREYLVKTSLSEGLIDLCKEIVWSLGGIFKVIDCVNYRILFPATNRVMITEVKEAEMGEAKCITIDDEESLYITENHVVTHNTYISLAASTKINYRVGIFIESKYKEKWIEDIKKNTKCKDSDIYVVQGSPKFNKAIRLIKEKKFKYKYVVFSVNTLAIEYKKLEMGLPAGIDTHIYKVAKLFGIGFGIYDEVHSNFLAMYKTILVMDIVKTVALSATLESLDRALEVHYLNMFPKDIRLNYGEYDKYIDVCAMAYASWHQFNGKKQYSHNEYEKFIMSNQTRARNYLNMIYGIVDMKFIEKRKNDKYRYIIFASSIDMCTLITDFLKKKLPKLDIRRYVEDDPYENAMEPDIIVSTIMSAGTALDIENLMGVLQTIMVMSIASNKQTLGRLRKLVDSDVEFTYIWNYLNTKHARYHTMRKQMLLPIVNSFMEQMSDYKI